MSRIFSAGAEAASLGVFASVGAGASVSAVQKRTGVYSFLNSINPGMPELGKAVFLASKTVLYFRLGLYLTELYAPGYYAAGLIQLFNSSGVFQCGLSISIADKILHVVRGRAYYDPPLGDSAHAVPLNQWCCIEWYIKIGESPDGESTIKIDGTTELTLTGQDTRWTSIAGAQSAAYASTTNTNDAVGGYFDDLAINDNAGAVNNSWIGRGGIYRIVPEGVGNYTDLHASAGNAWDCIDEVPPSDADYVYDDTVNQKSTYALTALVPTTGTIDCINVIMRAKLDAAGAGNIARLIRSNGTDSQGADVGLDVSPKTIQDIIETDPGAAPGTLWTIAAVNALEAGAVIR